MAQHVAPGEDAATILGALLQVVGETALDDVSVLRPLRDSAGVIVDFLLIASSGLRMSRLGAADAIGRPLSESLPPKWSSQLIAVNRELVETGRPSSGEMHFPSLDPADPPQVGEVHRVLFGGLVAVLWRDFTSERQLESDLAASEQRYQALVENASDVIVVVDANRALTYVSPAVTPFLGYRPEALLHSRWGSLTTPEDAEIAQALLDDAFRAPAGSSFSVQVRVVTSAGGICWAHMRATNHLDEPAVRGVVINIRDITAEREVESRLQRQALQDPLTGLPNRRLFLAALKSAIARVERSGRALGVLLVDIDNFKDVNDTLGHAAGDQLLVAFGDRLSLALRPGDTVARLGGDEFVVLAEDLACEDEAVAVAERLVAQATGTYPLDGVPTRVSLSVGVSTLSGSGGTPDVMLANADMALYEAKRRGRDRIEAYDPALHRSLFTRLRLAKELQRALDYEEFELFWQPIVRVEDGAVTAAEALLRWWHPTRGLLVPADFLQVAQDVGLMGEITSWVLDAAIAQAAAWSVLPVPPDVFINLAARDLANPELGARIAARADAAGVATSRLVLEISERTLDADVPLLAQRVQLLRAFGLRIALDDFGAGYTALTWLVHLPLDVLKMDLAFTTTLHTSTSRAIVTSVVQLAAALGIDSVAEGVETPEQQAVLAAMGCRYTQGRHLAHPQPAASLTATWS